MKRARIARIIYFGLVMAAYVSMTAGYIMRGEVWYDACYYALQAFFMNFTTAEEGNIILFVGRFICPLLTATGLFVVLRSGLKKLADAWVSRMKNATAVYYDTEQMKELGKGFHRPILMGDKVNKKAKSHVLLLENDVDNLTFYEKVKDELKEGSKVYIRLENVESKLLKKSDVYYFNVNEIIARTYWKERNLQKYMKNGNLEVKIAILGFDALGQNLLDYGLMNNVYSLNQSVRYHIWGESRLYRNLLGEFDKMNEDTITYHDGDWWEALENLKEFDRIIVAQDVKEDILQTLLYLSCDAEIDFYNPEGVDLPELYLGDKLTGFGALKDILTEETIKTDKLYREAKEINYSYVVKDKKYMNKTGEYTWERPDVEQVMEEQWNGLDGFTKGSNVACADYQHIRRLVMDALGMSETTLSEEEMEMLSEMEHVRWSRYHYVNHWRFGEKEDMPLDSEGKKANKDKARRLHTALVPYVELSEDVKDKDKDAIREMFEER